MALGLEMFIRHQVRIPPKKKHNWNLKTGQKHWPKYISLYFDKRSPASLIR